MSKRQRLENRRPHISFRFKHLDTWFTCGLGYYFLDDGTEKLGEVFLNADKVDSDLDVNVRDAAIATSFALQYGAEPSALYRAMSRNPNGTSSGALGKILGMVVRGDV